MTLPRGYYCRCKYSTTGGLSGILRNHRLTYFLDNCGSSIRGIFLNKTLQSQGRPLQRTPRVASEHTLRHLDIQMMTKRFLQCLSDISISFLSQSQHSKCLTKEIFAVQVLCTPCITSTSSIDWRCPNTEKYTEWLHTYLL